MGLFQRIEFDGDGLMDAMVTDSGLNLVMEISKPLSQKLSGFDMCFGISWFCYGINNTFPFD